MASPATIRYALRRVVQAFRNYAVAQGWRREDYRLYLDFNEDWGVIHVLFVAKAFPGKDPEEQWLSVLDFVNKDLKDEPFLRDSLHFILRTFDQVKEGGLYEIGPQYTEVDDLLGNGAASEA